MFPARSALGFLLLTGAAVAQQYVISTIACAPQVQEPFGLAVDASGNVYVGDISAQRVFRITPSGTITTVAGNGSYQYCCDNGQFPFRSPRPHLRSSRWIPAEEDRQRV